MLKQYLEMLLNGCSVPLLIIIVSAFRADPQRRRWDFTTVIGYVTYAALAFSLTQWVSPHPYDAAFLRADRALGFNPVAFADMIARYPTAEVTLLVTYIALPLMMGLAWVLEQSLQMRRALLIGGCLCFVGYIVFPAVGPGHFDWINQVPISGSPANCMPSMHLTWALLLAINARSKWLRGVLWGYAILIALATVGLREHYLVDLIAAVPYTFAIQKLSGMMEAKPLGSLARQVLQSAKGYGAETV